MLDVVDEEEGDARTGEDAVRGVQYPLYKTCVEDACSYKYMFVEMPESMRIANREGCAYQLVR